MLVALVPTLIETTWVEGCFKQLNSAAQEELLFASEPYPEILLSDLGTIYHLSTVLPGLSLSGSPLTPNS